MKMGSESILHYPKNCNTDDCEKPMMFVMEIKSREDITNGKAYLMFGDCGSLYVFSCCKSIFVTMQCT